MKKPLTADGVEEIRDFGKETGYTLTARKPKEWEAPGVICYDLTVFNARERCVLPDVARDAQEAHTLLAYFKKNGVRPEEALYVMEDLLASL